MSTVNDDGKVVTDDKAGYVRFDPVYGFLQLKRTQPSNVTCPCPCYNYYTVVCVENDNGDSCVGLWPSGENHDKFDCFCRTDYFSDPAQHYKPQLYTAEEVKLFYPNWQSIDGWDEVSDLWIEFSGELCTWEYEDYVWNPTTGDYDYIRSTRTVWIGPPVKNFPEKIDYDICLEVTDFTDPGDKEPVCTLLPDILDCPIDYLIEYKGESCPSDYGPNPTNLWHNATGCTSECRCTFTKGSYKQWKKNNNRAVPYLYVQANVYTGYSYYCTEWGPSGSSVYGQCQPPNKAGIAGIYFAHVYQHAAGSNVLNITFNNFQPASPAWSIAALQFTNLTANGIWTLPLVITGRTDVSGEVTVEIVNGAATVTMDIDMPCLKCSVPYPENWYYSGAGQGRGDKYHHEETFTLGTYKYQSRPWACAECTGNEQLITSQNQWCYRPSEERPAGLFTKCASWYASTRCTDEYGMEGYLDREALFQSCDTPPNLIGWYALFSGYHQQSGHESGQISSGISVGRSNTCTPGWGNTGVIANPRLVLLWDNGTESIIEGAALTARNMPAINNDPNLEIEWNDNTTRGYITKCCHRYYYKVQLTAGPMKWIQWPNVGYNATGVGYFGLPESLTLHFWADAGSAAGTDLENPEEGLFKLIEKTFPFSFPDPGNNPSCIYDPQQNTCTPRPTNGRCGCDMGSALSCGPFSGSCGTTGTYPLQNVPGNPTMSFNYGTPCMVSQSYDPRDSQNRNVSRSCARLPAHEYICSTGGNYPSSYFKSAAKPKCYYKDCIYAFGIGGDFTTLDPGPNPSPLSTVLSIRNNITREQAVELITSSMYISEGADYDDQTPKDHDEYIAWIERRNQLIAESDNPEYLNQMGLPAVHGGFCKWSVVDDSSRICGTCQYPYIRCTSPELIAIEHFFTQAGFQPRLCGDTKCTFFEPKEARE